MTDEMTSSADLSDSEVLDLMKRNNNFLSNAWREFRLESARIEQALDQQKPPNVTQIRRMELDATIKILRAAGMRFLCRAR